MTAEYSIRYHTGRVEVFVLADPATFTDAERAAHARIYAETGSLIAAYCAGIAVH
jgi:hypothetical protein